MSFEGLSACSSTLHDSVRSCSGGSQMEGVVPGVESSEGHLQEQRAFRNFAGLWSFESACCSLGRRTSFPSLALTLGETGLLLDPGAERCVSRTRCMVHLHLNCASQ